MASAEIYLAADESVLTPQQVAKLAPEEKSKAKARASLKKAKDAAEQRGYERGLEDGESRFQPYLARAVDVFDKIRTREEAKHGNWKLWRGRFEGLALGMFAAIGFMLAYNYVSAAHDHQLIVTGAAVGAANPVVLHDCVNGRTNDGTACGLPQQAP